MADLRLPSSICNEVYFLKHKLHTSKIVFLILLLTVTFILIGFRAIIEGKDASIWYAPLIDITYHRDWSSSSGCSTTFLLHKDGDFELSYGQTTCHGHFETDFPNGNEVLSPQRDLYSFSFRIPCSTHADHSFYFTIYPNDLNFFTVNVETSSTDTEMLWLTANNSATLTVPAT